MEDPSDDRKPITVLDVRELADIAHGRGGVTAADLPPNTELTVIVGGQPVLMCFTEHPETGSVAISSRGSQWAIWTHLTDNWGCTVGPDCTAMRAHWLAPGCRLNVGPVTFPVVEKILLQGLDLANPAASQRQ